MLWIIDVAVKGVIAILAIFLVVVFVFGEIAKFNRYQVTINKVEIVVEITLCILCIFDLVINAMLRNIRQCMVEIIFALIFVVLAKFHFAQLKKEVKENLTRKNKDTQ